MLQQAYMIAMVNLKKMQGKQSNETGKKVPKFKVEDLIFYKAIR